MPLNRRTFLKHSALGALQLGILSQLPASAGAPGYLKRGQLPRSSPESRDISSEAILNFVGAVGDSNLHSLMIVKSGHVVAEGWWAPYAPELKHTLYSLSKSFTSTAIGFAVNEGKLTVNDKVVSFFPDKLPPKVSEYLAGMRIRDLLTMSTGHSKDTVGHFREPQNTDWVRAFLAQPVDHEPGTHFVYNSGATYMLSAILQKVTGQNLTSFLKPRLFVPLDITDTDWETDPAGIEAGGWGLRVKTEDIAKFGQLYLQEGKWKGRNILPASWIKEASTAHIMQPGEEKDRPGSDWLQGYGYQFWRCRHNGYRGDGAYGQYCIVMPEQQMVIAITSETSDMQRILNHAWKHLLSPGKKTAGSRALGQKLKSLALPLPKGTATSSLVSELDGSRFTTGPNTLGIQEIGLSIRGKSGAISIIDDKGAHPLKFGINEWAAGETGMAIEWLKLVPTAIPGNPPLQTRGTAFWKDDRTLELTCRFIDTAHYMRLTLSFRGNTLTAAFEKSISVISNDAKPYVMIEGTRMG